MSRPRTLSALLALAVLLALISPCTGPTPTAEAAAITVTTEDDEDNTDLSECSLREAITAANTDSAYGGCPAGSGDDIITLPAGYYTLTIDGTNEEDNATGDLDITSSLTINGEGEGITIIQGGSNSTNGIDRVLDTHGLHTVEINDVRIRYGRAPGISGETDGGGLRNGSNLTLNNCTVSSNSAPTSAGRGGGITNSGALTLNNSTVGYNDSSYRGGGIYNKGNATMTLNNSTVNNNDTGDRGGGFYNLGNLTLNNCTVSGNTSDMHGGGIHTDAMALTLVHTTIASNTADNDNNGTGDGGGIYVEGGTAHAMNTIIGRNQDWSGEAFDCSGTLTSQGYNLLEWTNGCTFTPTTGDITGVNPSLGLLAENGGATRTHELNSDSPAIDEIPDGVSGCQGGASTDQRGYPRAGGFLWGGSSCDIGAFEYATNPPFVMFVTGTYAVNEGAGTANIMVYLNLPSGDTVTVDYATSNGTATAGSDYSARSGTLTFAPGVTNRSFSVPINDDTLDEGDETVNLTLSNATNALIWGTNPATLWIEDNEGDFVVYLPLIPR
jgi:CSLREA domain-containing protein